MVLPPPLESYGDSGLTGLWELLAGRASAVPFNLVAFILFGLAVIHTFLCSRFSHLAHYLEKRHIEKAIARGKGEGEVSFWAEVCSFLGEVEVVFGLWCIPLLIAMLATYDWATTMAYVNSRSFTEPLFIMIIMVIASTRPILRLAEGMIRGVARVGGGGPRAWWFSLLTVGPLLGSVITEPAAMTICALLMARQFYARHPRKLFAYATLGLLFTNISVGGVLTNFAAPPVLIVAERWGFGAAYMFTTFGWRAIVGVVVANALYFSLFYREFDRLRAPPPPPVGEEGTGEKPIPIWVTAVHVAVLGWEVFVAHDTVIAIGTLLLFLGFHQATAPHQSPLSLRQPLLVGLFLAGLVILGGLQGWWIAPLLGGLSEFPLMLLSIFLTAINDNAEITYLSSLIPNFSEAMKYAVIAGAVTGGGLTVIANAPNLIGVQTCRRYFEDGISPLWLFLGAFLPMVVMGLAFTLL
ncbi:MAG: putative Na+/H+ antiporter [Parachlamydiales bacterium]